MIFVRVTGGLGNQMFQYAFARALHMRGRNVIIQWHGHRTKSFHNGWELDSVFEKPLSSQLRLANSTPLLNLAAWIARRTNRKREPRNRGFSPECLQESSGYLDGYWQSERYFCDYKDLIRADFTFKPCAGEQNSRLMKRLETEPAVSVHVRRGDYVNHSGLGSVCGETYYRNALEIMDSEHPGSPLLIFSDDIPYCRTLFEGRNAIFIDWNQGENSWMDMSLMSRCRHHVIANSSFSWWGAWLGEYENTTTIAPKTWYAESSGTRNSFICPDRWRLIQ